MGFSANLNTFFQKKFQGRHKNNKRMHAFLYGWNKFNYNFLICIAYTLLESIAAQYGRPLPRG